MNVAKVLEKLYRDDIPIIMNDEKSKKVKKGDRWRRKQGKHTTA